MSETYLDDLLDQLVTAEPRPAWDDVLRRNRRSRRHVGVIAAVVAVLVLAPVAWATDGFGFFGSPPPAAVTSMAAAMNRLAPQAVANAQKLGWPDPEQYGTTADLSKLHGLVRVQTPDGLLDAWGAPSSNGGLCYFLAYEADVTGREAGPGGGCTQPGGLAKNWTLGTDSSHPDVYLSYGYTDNADAANAKVMVQVGANLLSQTGPVVEGFYLVAFPRDPSTTDAWDSANTGIKKVVTYNANGDEVESWENPWQIPCPKPAGQGPCTPATP